MKRRTFIQGLGAGSALGIGNALGLAYGNTGVVTVRPLVAVHDRLPQALATVGQAQQLRRAAAAQPDSSVQGAWRLEYEDWDSNGYPLVIGLGPVAERIVDQVPERMPIPNDAGLYRTGVVSGDDAVDWLALRLQRCVCALLVIDAADPRARAEATDWTHQLAVSDVYLRAAVVLNARGRGPDPEWRAELNAPLIEIRCCEHGEDATGIVHALLPGLPFCQRALMCYDLSDVRTLLSAGTRARTTAVRWTQAGDLLPLAVANGCSVLDSKRSRGALAWLNTGIGFSMHEWDLLQDQLTGCFGPTVELMLAPLPRVDRPDGERVLSLTVMGD